MYTKKILTMQICISLLVVVLFSIPTFAQKTFERTYGGSGDDVGSYVLQATDGGYIVTGWTESWSKAGQYDAFLMKTDANGDTLWLRTYGGEDCDYGNCVQHTSDGGYVITGCT
jgi:hypothetical protein